MLLKIVFAILFYLFISGASVSLAEKFGSDWGASFWGQQPWNGWLY